MTSLLIKSDPLVTSLSSACVSQGTVIVGERASTQLYDKRGWTYVTLGSLGETGIPRSPRWMTTVIPEVWLCEGGRIVVELSNEERRKEGGSQTTGQEESVFHSTHVPFGEFLLVGL